MVYGINDRYIYDKWRSFRMHVIGLTFSYSAGTVSIDEKLEGTILVSGRGILNKAGETCIEAEELLEILGGDAQAFKNLIDYLLNPDNPAFRSYVIRRPYNEKLSSLIMDGIMWRGTIEGVSYWARVHRILIEMHK